MTSTGPTPTGCGGLVRRRINDPDLAAEVVQDTFVRAHAHFAVLDPARSAWPWLATVASNLSVDALRRAARDHATSRLETDDGVTSPETTSGVIDWSADPAQVFELSVRADAVRAAVDMLPARQLQALLLKDDEGWTTEQIARLDDISAEAVKSLMRRARVSFRRSYERVAGQTGLHAGLAVLGAPLARLRARLQRMAVGRIPTLPLPVLQFHWMPALSSARLRCRCCCRAAWPRSHRSRPKRLAKRHRCPLSPWSMNDPSPRPMPLPCRWRTWVLRSRRGAWSGPKDTHGLSSTATTTK